MIKTFTLKDGQKPTKEQIEEVRAAAKREIVFDEDAPELSPAMMKAFRCAVTQRNRSKRGGCGPADRRKETCIEDRIGFTSYSKSAIIDTFRSSNRREINGMTKEELMKISFEEFSRIQKWMLSVSPESETYQLMHERYKELKVILASLGVNITDLDMIK